MAEPFIRPSREYLAMTIVSKENHDIHPEGESEV